MADGTPVGFYPSPCGTFLCKRGPAHERGEAVVNKKLCLVATERLVLERLLSELSRRQDCQFVKFSIEPMDGMYLGRCFLSDEVALGTLWAELKQHPRVMCSLQDDDFVLRFRRA